MLDHDVDHYCPVYERIVCPDLCYDSLMCLNGTFQISSTEELSAVPDIAKARERCANCQYSEL